MASSRDLIQIDADGVRNPWYAYYAAMWLRQRDCYSGEDAIKAAGVDYLPMPSGMAAEQTLGGGSPISVDIRYSAYQKRADFPELLQDAVDGSVGLMFEDAGLVDLPESLKYLETRATATGDGIVTVMRATAREQLVPGRVFWLWTVDAASNELRLVEYLAEAILDWHSDADGNLAAIVLDESGLAYDGASWSIVPSYRVAGVDVDGRYYTGVVEDVKEFNFSQPNEPVVYETLHGVEFTSIPGVIFNSVDLLPDPAVPITSPVAQAALKAYMNSADLQHSLHLTAQPTLVVVGAETDGSPIILGSANSLAFGGADGTVKIEYLEINGNGLEMLDKSIGQYKADGRRHIELIEQGIESGVALNTRLAVKTATLQNVALTLAEGTLRLLRMAAEWSGADPADVKVQVNNDFRKDAMSVQDIVQLVEMFARGTMTKFDLFWNLKKAKRTQYNTFAEWEEALKDVDPADIVMASVGMGSNTFEASGQPIENNTDGE